MVTTPQRAPKRSVSVSLTSPEHDFIRDMAATERRSIGQMLKLAMDEYARNHGYGPMPKSAIVGRPPKENTDEDEDTNAAEDY